MLCPQVPKAEIEPSPPLLPLSRNPSFVIRQVWEEDAISKRSYNSTMWPEFRGVVDRMVIRPEILATSSAEVRHEAQIRRTNSSHIYRGAYG